MKWISILIISMSIILCGCVNENTPLQAVVDRYKTDEIKLDAYRPLCFIVRDTNNAIWYVETEQSGMNTNGNYEYYCVRNTLLFNGRKNVDKVKLED